MADVTRDEAKMLAHWYAASGVRDLATEAPVDAYAQKSAQAEKASSPSVSRTVRPQAPALVKEAAMPSDKESAMPSDKEIQDVAALAAGAKTLKALRAAMAGFEGCALKATAQNLVFADGDPKSRVMFIGEAPGAEEDAQGLPFVGRSGQLLNKMLAAIGLERAQIYISNILPWRPPGNRNPSDGERALCRPFLERHIVLSGAEILVFLGSIAAKEMLNTTEGITRLRGKWHEVEIGGKRYDALPMFHPAFLLRQAGRKRETWEDLKMLKARLDA